MNKINLASGVLVTSILTLLGVATCAEVREYRDSIANTLFLEQQHCVALNVYHEARGGSRMGMKAVAFVTLNRVQDNRYPDTPCDVVYQARLKSNGQPQINQCQFSWYCDGKADTPLDDVMWKRTNQVAYEVLLQYGNVEDPTEGAVMYHASYVSPYWSDSYKKTIRIDEHIFYK